MNWQSMRTSGIGLALAGVALGALVHDAEAQERVRWRVPIAFPSALPSLGDNLPWVAEQVGLMTDNRIELRVIEPGEMVPALELSEAVGQGQIPAGYNWLGYDQGRIPSSPLFAAVPFGMEPWEYMAWWYEGGGAELGAEVYNKINVQPIFCGITGPETAGWFKKEITSLDDIKGLKIRFAGLGGQVMEQLGASVSLIPGGEIYQSLERGVIDASEFSLPIVDQRLGFAQVAKYNYFPGWHQPFTAFHLIVNLDEWENLTPQDQTILEIACRAGVTNSLSISEARQGDVIKGFPELGVTATYFSEDILRKLQETSTQVLEQQAASDADFKKVYEQQQAFLENYKIWKGLAYLPRDF